MSQGLFYLQLHLHNEVKRLALCYPWDSPFIFTAFTESVLNMKKPDNLTIRWFRGKGWCSSRRHIHCLEQAVAWKSDLICFLGSDQIFPEDLLIRFYERIKQGYEVISVMIPIRGHITGQNSKPFQPLAWKYNKQKKEFETIDKSKGDVQEIDVIGSGAIMFPANLLNRLKKPWFKDDLDYSTCKRKQLDDSIFVWRLRHEAGASIYVDTTINIKHAHIFHIDETYQKRFYDWV